MDNQQDETQMVLQHKKDQFRVEIRKKKTDNLIQQKRLKLFLKNQNQSDQLTLDNNNNIQNNDSNIINNSINNQDLQTHRKSQNKEADLKLCREIEQNLKNSLKENDIEQTRNILQKLAAVVGINPTPIDSVYLTELPQIILSIVKKQSVVTDQQSKVFAAHVLANLTSGTPEQLQQLFQMNLIPILIEQIPSRDIELADHILWAFNNVLIDHHQPQNLIRIFQERESIIEDLCYYFSVQIDNSVIQRQLISTVILCLFILNKIYTIDKSYYHLLRICVPYLAKLLDQQHPGNSNVFQKQNIAFSSDFFQINTNLHIKNSAIINSNSNNNNNQMIENNNDNNNTKNNNSNNSNNNNNANNNNNNQVNLNNSNDMNKQKNEENIIKHRFLSPIDMKFCVIMLSTLSEGDSRVISSMQRAQVDRVMLRYLEQGACVNDSFISFVIRTLANMSSGTDFQTDQLISKDIYKYLERFLGYPVQSIRKDVAWLISNLTAGNQSQVEVFIQNKMVQKLMHRLNVESSQEVKAEVIYALSNATTQASKEQINHMVSLGLLRALSDSLDCPYQLKFLLEILEAIENIMIAGRSDGINYSQNLYLNEFESTGCKKKLQDLYYSHKNEIATEIINRILSSIQPY